MRKNAKRAAGSTTSWPRAFACSFLPWPLAFLRIEHPGEAVTDELERDKLIRYCTVGKLNRVAPCWQGLRRTLSFLWATSLGIKLRDVLVHLIQG